MAIQLTDDVIVDTYVDVSFTTRNLGPYLKPWIGFVHHPVNGPNGFAQLLQNSDFVTSMRYCKGLITLSRLSQVEIGRLVKKNWPEFDIPVFTLRHPTVAPKQYFTKKAFQNNSDKRAVHIGNWLRDIRWFLDEFNAPFKKGILNGPLQSFASERPDLNIGVLSHDQYDQLLSQNIVAIKLKDANAVNTIIECIMRDTPIIVNRLPATEEYLGANYPFFTDVLGKKAVTTDDIFKAHTYLQRLDKYQLAFYAFIESYRTILDTLRVTYTVSVTAQENWTREYHYPREIANPVRDPFCDEDQEHHYYWSHDVKAKTKSA